jgi:polyisoprenoid-binding protein YceI
MMAAEAGGTAQAGADVQALVRDGALAGRWVLDPGASRVEFHVRHFWGAVTVRGWFERLEGEGAVGPDGKVAGQLVVDAGSLNTKNKQRDRHLRSADFFDAQSHPRVVLTVSGAELTRGAQLAAEGELEAAGVREPLSFTAEVVDASPDAVTLQAELTVDRSRFGMTWSPLRMASMQATGSVTARFTRAGAGSPPAAGPA